MRLIRDASGHEGSARPSEMPSRQSISWQGVAGHSDTDRAVGGGSSAPKERRDQSNERTHYRMQSVTAHRARFADRDGAFYTWRLRNGNTIGLTN